MIQRIITSVIGLIILVPLVIYGGYPLIIATAIVAILSVSEILSMKKMLLINFEAFVAYVGVAVITLPNSVFVHFPKWLSSQNIFFVVLVVLLISTFFNARKFNFEDVGVVAVSVFYIGQGFHYLLEVREQSLSIVFFALLIVWMTDSFAYLTGRQFGKTKLAPNISPGKTIEGSIGGTLITVLLVVTFNVLFPSILRIDTVTLLIITTVLSITGQIGDLIESSIKRFYNAKDSGSILPGHGGLLDRFDSMLLVFPVLFLLDLV